MRFLFSLIYLSLIASQGMTQSQPQLIYVGDPMCSWCYGISEELAIATEELKDEVNFRMIMGGLRPYNTETMVDLSDFLKHHWDDVSKMSGQPFSYEILQLSDMKYDTEIPSRATIIVRHIDATKEYAFFKAVQKAFYLDNKRTDDINTYLEICETLSIDQDAFRNAFDTQEAKANSSKDFEASRSLGVNSFPTILLKHNGQVNKIANGYIPAAEIVSKIRKEIRD